MRIYGNQRRTWFCKNARRSSGDLPASYYRKEILLYFTQIKQHITIIKKILQNIRGEI